ncbi:HAD family acid phosphatase [Dokdonella sp.]|uniref:5'-nucleotidase, lipoprotein e(P4) family n=1 Tax=Dokdonella sp. TaxID=2291710 RepID=UPI001B205854|nr:HAD family acid phosphatase [Dokdonella sp.]MBO9661315.1 acid phosphatase [Dokdonella sp.]
MSKISLSLALAAALLAGCAGAPSARRTPAPVAPPVPAGPPANDNLNAVVWTQTAVEHDLIYREVFRQAGEKLAVALKTPKWDALAKGDRKRMPKGAKPAVIVDIDETMLDNSPYQARLVQSGGEYNEATWAAWCQEKAAKPLPGALEFAKLAAKRGVTVFYLSNRAQDLNEVTLENLREAGFPIADESVFLGLGTVVEGCEQNGTEKGCRRALVGRKHRVLMQLGDQLGDFVDPVANTPDGRRSAVEPYLDWIGERWFVLPNPTYGSWEPALFNNDWSQGAEARRRAKMDALRK